ncbi:MAG TPA: nuclear transport factor 2 family protein [Chitinophagaceae bacterium]|nr:nuclear transport factor 2 family protein [Chitinophagaceae bacterium]
MKQIFSLSLLLLLVSCGNDKPGLPDAAADVQRLNHLYDNALIANDTALLNNLYAPDFIYTNPDGKLLNKEQQLLNVATSEMKWDNGKSEDVKVSLYGNMAVVTGAFRASGSYRANPLSIHERYTTVWIKTDTSWAIVAEQGNIIR